MQLFLVHNSKLFAVWILFFNSYLLNINYRRIETMTYSHHVNRISKVLFVLSNFVDIDFFNCSYLSNFYLMYVRHNKRLEKKRNLFRRLIKLKDCALLLLLLDAVTCSGKACVTLNNFIHR